MKRQDKFSENQVVISIDPGEIASGMSIIMLNRHSSQKVQLIGFEEQNSTLVTKIKKYYVKYKPIVVIEDILPYRQKVSLNVIATCKVIGELHYRLKNQLKLKIEYRSRVEVKKWIFDGFKDLCVGRIDKKLAYLDDYGEKNNKRRYRNKDGNIRKASFQFVDDRVVIAVMKEFWNVPTPKPGKPNIYGLSGHAWQALAVGTCYLSNKFGNDFIELVNNCDLSLMQELEVIP